MTFAKHSSSSRYRTSYKTALMAGLSTVLLVGCGQSSSLQNKPIEATSQIQTLRPSEPTQQLITAYRSIFVDNISRAKNGVEQLKQSSSPQASNLPTSPLTTFSPDDAGNRYDMAISALYADGTLSQPAYTTLMDMATFVPDIFKDKEINQRLQAHDPALARLVNQHLVWREQQITLTQQIKDNEASQNKQYQALNTQIEALNKTIANYDKQIAIYQLLAQDVKDTKLKK